VRVEVKLDKSFVAELDHADADSVHAYVQFADDAFSEVLHSSPVAFVMFVDASGRVDDEHDVCLGVTRRRV